QENGSNKCQSLASHILKDKPRDSTTHVSRCQTLSTLCIHKRSKDHILNTNILQLQNPFLDLFSWY
ncbi:MAG: hypothetical protein NTX81_08820, partial [Candidatus Bathyarchaeota archaeon]|nr:hypothetical protein [Candidatus Bathyarchaeota archaeon]